MGRLLHFLTHANKLWIIPGLLLLVSLVYPGTRELHLLLIRLYCRIPGPQTYVHGQPPGCVIYVIPTVKFNKNTERRILAESNRSVDTFALAHVVNHNYASLPSAETCSGHPLLPWVAFRAADLAYWQAWRSEAHSETQPSIEDDPRPSVAIDEALKIIRMAQANEPENGLLWLAESVVHFAGGSEETAFQAIREAANKKTSNDHVHMLFPYLRDLLVQHGFPRFDASWSTHLVAWDRPGRLCRPRVREELLDRMILAVENKDDARLMELLSHLIALYEGCAHQNVSLGKPVGAGERMIAGMISRLGRQMPDEKADYAVRKHAEEAVLYDYLAEYASTDLSARLRELADADQTGRPGIPGPSGSEANHLLKTAILSSAASEIAFLLMGLGLATLIAQTSFGMIRKQGMLHQGRVARSWLWPSMLLAAVLMTGAVFNALDLTLQPVGLRVADREPSPSPTQSNLGTAVAFAAILLLVQFVRTKVPRLYRVSVVVMFCVWLVLVGVAAWLREDAVTRLAASYATSS
ncbi:MAG TPA: hypothetical protein PLL20_15895 [Phycisphaerae bacterium]|nr:hypothetical protein [Phycisphaerae bacterium]HRR86578.1 hypothetical protein [Phycisphaerae bacterium]